MKKLNTYIIEKFKISKDNVKEDNYTNIDKLVDWYLGAKDSYQSHLYNIQSFFEMLENKYKEDFKLNTNFEFIKKYYHNHNKDKFLFTLTSTEISFNLPECRDKIYILEVAYISKKDLEKEIEYLSV